MSKYEVVNVLGPPLNFLTAEDFLGNTPHSGSFRDSVSWLYLDVPPGREHAGDFGGPAREVAATGQSALSVIRWAHSEMVSYNVATERCLTMRKIIAGGITALVASGVLLAGAGPASAAPAPRLSTTSVAKTATNYEYYTWYWTQPNCESAGAALQVRGVISNYYCQQSGYTTWYLYVAYR